MKTKSIYLVPALSLAALSPLSAQSTAVDKSAANYKTGPFSDYSNIIKKVITAVAEDDLPEGLTTEKLLDATGLGNIKTYEQSSTPDGNEWINKIYLNNGGKHSGALKLLSETKHNTFSVAEMSPAGTDFALQFGLNLKSAKSTIEALMKTGAPESEIEDFKKGMSEEVPMLGLTTSELLQKLDLRCNLALDLDPNEKLPTPIGALGKPNLVLRFDGITWIWDKVGGMMIGQTGLPFAKAEKDGVTSYSLPTEMAAQSMGYSPKIRVDFAKDQIWIASSPDFLNKCTNSKDTLAASPAYKTTMTGLPIKGQLLTYMSKDFANFLTTTIEGLKKQTMLEAANDTTKSQVDFVLKQLGNVQKGAAQVVSIDSKGVFIAERNVQNIDQQMTEMNKAIEQIKKAALTP